MDKATLGGVLVGMGGIVAGLLLEGGNLSQILQPTAAMIVFGGTLGAILIQYPLPVVLNALRSLIHVFTEPKNSPHAVIQGLVRYANQARREGIVSLDAELGEIHDPFLKKALMLAVDGTEPEELRKIMAAYIDLLAGSGEGEVFEDEGVSKGFSALVLLDMSGSMESVWDDVSAACSVLARALKFPFSKFEVWGFNGNADGKVFLYRFLDPEKGYELKKGMPMPKLSRTSFIRASLAPVCTV